MTLQELKKDMENLKAAWDGEEEGARELNADIATQVLKRIEEIEALLENLF